MARKLSEGISNPGAERKTPIETWLSKCVDKSRQEEVENSSQELGERLGKVFRQRKEFCQWLETTCNKNLLICHGLGTVLHEHI